MQEPTEGKLVNKADILKADPIEKHSSTKTEAKQTRFAEAVEWAVDKSKKEHQGRCGICTWSPWNTQDPEALAGHIRRRHRDTILQLHDHGVLDLDALNPTNASQAEDELLAAAGLTEVRQLDRTDLLSIPEDLRKQAEINGETFWWKRREEVDMIKQQGAEVVHLNGNAGDYQHSSEDGILRAREMVCVKVPFELTEKRRKQKHERVNDQLQARAEEMKETTDKYEKKIYDHLRGERNLDHQQAKQVTKAMMHRRQTEGGSEGVTVADRHGETTY